MKGVYRRAGKEMISKRIAQLKILQNLPYEKKIKLSMDIISQVKISQVKKESNALLFSGGKDSTVLLDLLKRSCINFFVLYNNTGIADPAMVQQARQLAKGTQYVETLADNAFEMWSRTGYYPILGKRSFTAYKKKYPDFQSSPVQCCYQLKEAHANKVLLFHKIKVVFWGNRADESNRRKLSFVDNGFLFQPKKYPWKQCYPLQHWKTFDIYRYLKENIDYDFNTGIEGGCIYCGTDLHYYPNNLSKLYFKDKDRWLFAMQNGFAKQILTAKGLLHDQGAILSAIENEKILLKI